MPTENRPTIKYPQGKKDSITHIDYPELRAMLDHALAIDKPDKEHCALLMAAMAARAEDLWQKERNARTGWKISNMALGGFGALLAAAGGGGVLVGPTGTTWKVLLGFAGLVGGALGGIAATLQTAQASQLADIKAKRLEPFVRDLWLYLITDVPTSSAEQIVAELRVRSALLGEIVGIGVLTPIDNKGKTP